LLSKHHYRHNQQGVELFLATDVVVADKFAADAAVQVVEVSKKMDIE
jgi:hypothetical protein